ncbi:carbohydrate porin [Methylosinus sp. H3A]|uniref:carbohydrate porin n=1 Tax=Methylosinus sp. H3A TaxID=2785786 RepID=UPI0018C2C445|nr:carbohydrate porin [Methylosinus sp. H3A]MBG0809129.1 carbohydrate porin [Methylosinus sp. H3A]
MKPKCLATLATLTLAYSCASPSAAADKPSETSAPPAFTWAGLHIGLNAGAGLPIVSGGALEAGSGFTSRAFDLPAPNRDRAGASFGAQIGYDWQHGPWVYGLETDLNFLGLRRASTGVFPAPAAYRPLGITAYGLTSDENGDYFASIRARLGYAVDRTLFYATGGVAAGGGRGASNLVFYDAGPLGLFFAPVSKSSRMKYAVGAGVEYALYDHLSARLEYVYLNQQLQNRVYDNNFSFQFAARQRSEAHVLRLGLNYRFDPQDEARGNEARSDEDKTADERGNESPSKDAEAKKRGAEKAKSADKGKEKEKNDEKSKNDEERYSFHGQTTAVLQGYPKFPALYSGSHSFPPKGLADAGTTSNLFFGMRLWRGAAVYLNPEIDMGYGLANSVGAASYVNGAVAKVGRAAPYMRFQRYFLRQIIGLDGGEKVEDPETGSFNEVLESTQNQLSGKVDKDRLILTIGKFSVPDIFDDNKYAHDPTTGFLNFGVNTLGAFDYAADSWGYTYGAALEWKQDWWTARGGLFQLSEIPNGPSIEPQIGRQFMGVAEFEARYDLFDQPGVIKFLAFADNGNLAKVQNAIDFAYLAGSFPPDVNNPWIRKRHVKVGGGVNVQQQLSKEIGFFLRASMSDGRFETVDYTDIDRSLSTGFTAAGALWGRDKDEIGGAMVFSGLAGPRVSYFDLGGTSVYIGDGGLSYAGEKVLETYYKYNVRDGVELTLDYQLIGNPAHNAARGPINIFGLRLHAQF